MHALRSLGKLVWGSKEAPEQFKLKSGVLYELHPDAKVSRKCIYKDAELGIRRTNIAFQYQLVVQRVVDEGEADLLEEADDERAFLIGTELRFSGTMIEGAYGFKWVDPVSTENIRHEFVVEDDACTKAMRDAFALAVARCVWERKACRPYTEAPADEVQKILTQVEDDELEQLLSNVKIDNVDLAQAAAYEAEDVPQLERSYAAVPAPAAAAEQSTTEAHLALPAEPKEMKTGKVIVSVLGALYLFDPQLAEFVQIAADVALTVVETGKFTYWMNVASDNRDYSSQLIEPEMNAVFNNDYKSLIWNYFDFDTKAYSFSLVSADKEHYEAMHQGLTRAAYETLNEEPWSKVSEASQDYLLDAYEEDVEMLPAPENWDSNEESEEEEEEEENESDEEEHDSSSRHEPASTSVKTSKSKRHEEEDSSEGSEYESESDRSNSEESEEEEESEDEHEAGDSADNGAKNSKLAVGYKHGRSFVVRGNRIGVFRHTDDDKIEFDTTINRIDDTHGKEFTPSSVMLHEQDSALVLMNQQRPHELYRMDLEYGKVVDEWKVHEDIPTVNIAPNSKFSQMTGDKTLVGISHNMLYRIDPRLGGDNLVVQNEQQAYATKSHFTSAATTESGAIAVGSGKGEVRLFDRLGVRAKTVLPALGEPIIGIDVTSDGRYVVATCKTYLLLIDTKIPTDPDGKTGFQKPFPQAQKPAPKRLQLKPEHVVYMGAPISFTPAKFNQSPDGNHSEKTIVTSTGPFVITWNLRRALGTGRGDAYQIKQYPDMVVADNFRFGQDRSIVVTLPNDVQSVKRSQLAKPTRQSLMVRPSTPGTGSSRLLSSSRNDIVDAPY
ncbi:VID27 cytoplasmic protein-domain-containing protein [Coemansia spiralis]|nr:VID27 cytoplasmic protein-domain-containing protein [Coemansia spiralis]